MSAHAPVEMRFATGEVLSTWSDLSIKESFLDPLGSYEFTVSVPRERRAEHRALLAKGRKVVIAINGAQQATPIITRVAEKLDKNGHSFSVQCKSLLATAHEGCVDPTVSASVKADTAASELVLKALSPYGFDSIDADATALASALTGMSVAGRGPNVDVAELKHKDAQAQPGEAAYPFCARIFSRLGVALRVDENGALILCRPDYSQRAIATLVQDTDLSHAGDRMLADTGITVEATNDGAFSEYVVSGKSPDQYGQTSCGATEGGIIIDGATRPTSAPFGTTPLKTIPAGRHTYSAPDAPFKPRYRLDKKARDKARCEGIAQLMFGVHSSNAWRMKCAVQGLVSATGAVWTVDTIVRVFAADLGVDEELWVLEVERQVSRDRGATTSLTLIPKGALVLGEEGG